jgi:hypothetical protein
MDGAPDRLWWLGRTTATATEEADPCGMTTKRTEKKTDNDKDEMRGFFASLSMTTSMVVQRTCMFVQKKRGQGVLRSVAGDFGGEDADVVYAAIALRVVHAVADDELVGDFEGYVVGFDGDEAALGFVEAGGDF